MLLSIVIPAWNEEKLLPATLASVKEAVKALDAAGIEHELIVCDNNSTDRTGEVARAAGASVVFEPLNQISRARNAGAAAANGEWLLFIDADSEPPRELFEDMAAVLRDENCVGGGAVIRMDVRQLSAKAIIKFWEKISVTFRWAAGSFMFCRTAAFREAGGFSTKLYASEEIDLSKKLKRIGRKFGQRMVILTKHPLRTSGRKLELYKPWHHFRFMLRTVFTGGRTLKRRESCGIWYDGKR